MSWSQTHGAPTAHDRRGAGVSARTTQSGIATTAQLARGHDPRTQVVYAGSGRRLSAQQLDAAYRRLAEQDRGVVRIVRPSDD
jgi:hypothetical protein